MKALTLQQTNVASSDQQPPASCGRSLSSNYVPPSLENKLLAQSSMMSTQTSSPLLNVAAQPCLSLQPSSLSSTSSSLLSTASFTTSSFTSPLLSTENKLLSSNSPLLSFSLSSSVPSTSLVSTSMPSDALRSLIAHPPSFLSLSQANEQKKDEGRDEEMPEETPELIQSSSGDIWSDFSEESDLSSEEESMMGETDASTSKELQVKETESVDQELDFPEVEFPELDMENTKVQEELTEKKYCLLNAVSSSLVMKTKPPGQKGWKSKDSVWLRILKLSKEISVSDPEFLLKVALYTRQKLNIRITANFLLALAASDCATKPHFRRYFCAAVQLPSDWLEVVRIYTTCFKRSLPTCLKKAMPDKFKQFSEYQLAKYNTRKHRCKHSRNKPKKKMPSQKQLTQWARKLRSEASILKKFLQLEEKRVVVDKKQSEFSMKKMIKFLHIKEPAEHVMAILGKKYPADHKTFNRSGLKGEWDQKRAGQRMKLKQPQTWDRLLSLEGNKASTWEKLIDSKSLPFMAMLRNLRNMIIKGISEKHHTKILKRLTDKKAIIESRQFPFRFLAAYKVIMEILPMATATQQVLPSAVEILKDIVKKIPKSKRYNRMKWEEANKTRLKVTLGVPFIYRMYKTKKDQLKKASEKLFTVALLNRYREALEKAVQISCRYNIPPLPGRTVILLPQCMSDDDVWSQKQDFCLPPYQGQQKEKQCRKKNNTEEKDKLTPSKEEVAVLLALMICSSAEDCQLCLTGYGNYKEVELKSDVLLDNVSAVMKQMKTVREIDYEKRDRTFLYRTFTKKNKVDNIIILAEYWICNEVGWAIKNYKKDGNNKALVVNLCLSDQTYSGSELPSDGTTVNLTGFSEQMLRFVAERGSSRLLDHVEHLDKLYNIPPPEKKKAPETTSTVLSIPASPKLRWRSVRVFISSTFRDMHSERDVLVQSVFPELRRRAAAHCLYLQEVELRWGVTEDESERATELCLSEVCRSQLLVAILGERYGAVPPTPVLPDLPQYSWLASAPAGLSVTEMEIRQFQALHPEDAHERMFCYFRDPSIIKSVPVAWRSHFAPESKDAQQKMTSLKNSLKSDNVKVTEDYSCEWGSIVDGKPCLKNLEDFGKAVLEDLWMAVKKLFVEEAEEQKAAQEVYEQEVQQGKLQRQFFGRSKLLSGAVAIVEQAQAKGQMMVIDGGPGEGKTVFMAALGEALRTGAKSRKNLSCNVISYSTAASQSAHSVENLVRCLILWLRKIKDTNKEFALPHSHKDLLAEFHAMFTDMDTSKPLVLLIDGVDLIRDGRGQLSCDWIPQELPKGVCLIVSIPTKAALLQTLVKKTGTVLFSLGQLTVPDRKEIVQKELDAFGKKLSDSALNNQLQMLIMKKGAVSPRYLNMACEDLRNFATFDKLNESLQGLPESLTKLVQYSLERLCSHYRDVVGLRSALSVLTVSATGLNEGDLYSVLNTCAALFPREVSWKDLLEQTVKPTARTPMATFARIVQSLRSLIGSTHCHDTDDLLALTIPEVKRAFEEFIFPAEGDRSRAHLVLAAHLWTKADPERRATFLHAEVNSLKHLPFSLIQSGQVEALQSLLSSYFFLYANVRNGLLQHLLETYDLFQKECSQTCSSNLKHQDCRQFLLSHLPILSSWPALFIQEALRDPPSNCSHEWAKDMVNKGGIRVVECQNYNCWDVEELSVQMSTFPSEPTCLTLSPDELLMVVGSRKGMLHVLSAPTGQEVKSLVSSCDGISSCVFLKDGRLATTSFDGRIEIWDVENGCRTARIDGHTNAITASAVTGDRKQLATVSLDFMLKVWSSAKGIEVASLLSPSPMNCVTFDSDGHLLAAGCWNGKVTVWNWLQNKTLPLLCGHQRSVRSVSFTSSSMLCSGSISGEVRVWSVPTATCVGCFQAHNGATEAIRFLEEENMLLTAGSDHKLHLWSDGLGRSVATIRNDEKEQEPPHKKIKCAKADSTFPLCVAVNGDSVAVGYHNDSIKIFDLDSGEKIQSLEYVKLSILCLFWVTLDKKKKEPELLVAAGSDKRQRMYKKKTGEEGMMGMLEDVGLFCDHSQVVLAMAQNSTHLATASDDCKIFLYPLSELLGDPMPTGLLQEHSGGVTCITFSPDGTQLLSGGKDKALMLWDVSSSPPVLSKPLPHAHRDWVTGCIWTKDCVISSSNDGRLCFWDLKAAQCLKEISWKSPLTSICCLGEYVMAGCAEGGLHVWNWETRAEISHIAAHRKRIHHCYLLENKGKKKDLKVEEMTVFTASDDGTVKVWKPLQVDHLGTYQGHSAIQGLALKEEYKEFVTVSEDCSLRCWTWMRETPPTMKDSVTVLCYSENGEMFLTGYTSGLLEVWHHGAMVGHKQISDSPITAACFMPNDQFAVSCMKQSVVEVWKLVRKGKSNTPRKKSVKKSQYLAKLTTYKVENPIVRLFYCSTLFYMSHDACVYDVSYRGRNTWRHQISGWNQQVRVLGVIPNDQKSVWLVGDNDGKVNIGFMFTMGSKAALDSAFSTVLMEEVEQVEEEEKEEEEEEDDEEEEDKQQQEEEKEGEGEEAKEKEGEEEKDHETVEEEEKKEESEEWETEEGEEEEETEEEEEETGEGEDEEEETTMEEEEEQEETLMECEGEEEQDDDKGKKVKEGKEIEEEEEEEKEKEKEEEEEEEEEEQQKKANESLLTAVTIDKDFVVCGDVEGNMWFNQPPELLSWSSKKPAHSGRITQLSLTGTTIISASLDRTVKLWDRKTKKQVGMFVCEGPIMVLEVNPVKPTELLCGDGNGQIYTLSWKE